MVSYLLLLFNSVINNVHLSGLLPKIITKNIGSLAEKKANSLVKILWDRCKKMWKKETFTLHAELHKVIREAHLYGLRYMVDRMKLTPAYKYATSEEEKTRFDTAIEKWLKDETRYLRTLHPDQYPEALGKIEALISGGEATSLEDIKADMRLAFKNDLWKELETTLMTPPPAILRTLLYEGWFEDDKKVDWFDVVSTRFSHLLVQPEGKAAFQLYQDTLLADIRIETETIRLNVDALLKASAGIQASLDQSATRDKRIEETLEKILVHLPAGHPMLEEISTEITLLKEKIQRHAARLERVQEKIDKYPGDNDFRNEYTEVQEEQMLFNRRLTEAYTKLDAFRDKIILLFQQVETNRLKQHLHTHERLVEDVKQKLYDNKLADIREIINLDLIEKKTTEHLAGKTDSAIPEQLAVECLLAIIPLELDRNYALYIDEIHTLYRTSIRLHPSFDNLYGYSCFQKDCGDFLEAIDHLIQANRFASQAPEMQSRIFNELGDLYMLSNQHLEAKNAYRKALEVIAALPDSDTAGRSRGLLPRKIANACSELRLYDQSESWYLEAISALEDQQARNPAGSGQALIEAYNGLGFVYIRIRRYADALVYLNKALGFPTHTGENDVYQQDLNLAGTYTNLGTLWYDQKEYAAASDLYEKAKKILLHQSALNPESHQLELAQVLNNFGLLYRDLEKWEAAENELKAAYTIFERVRKKNPTLFDYDLGMIEVYIGGIRIKYHDYKNAEKNYQKALARFISLHRTDPESYDQELAICYDALGLLYRDLENRDQALSNMKKAYSLRQSLYEKAPAVFDHQLALNAFNVGSLYQGYTDYKEAMNYYEKALTILRPLFNANPVKFRLDLVHVLINTGITCADDSMEEEAYKYLEEVLSIIDNAPGNEQDILLSFKALALHNLAATFDRSGKYDASYDHYSRAFEIYKQLSADVPVVYDRPFAMTAHNIAVVLQKMGKDKQAAAFCVYAITIKRRLMELDSDANAHSMLLTLINYAAILKRHNKQEEHFGVLLSAIKLCERLLVLDLTFSGQFMEVMAELTFAANALEKVGTITPYLEIATALVYNHKNKAPLYAYYFLILEKAWEAAGTDIHTVWNEIILPRMTNAERP